MIVRRVPRVPKVGVMLQLEARVSARRERKWGERFGSEGGGEADERAPQARTYAVAESVLRAASAPGLVEDRRAKTAEEMLREREGVSEGFEGKTHCERGSERKKGEKGCAGDPA